MEVDYRGERKAWVDTFVKLEVVMGLVFGKLFGRGEFFFSLTSFEVGNGRSVKFWTNRWRAEEPLCNFFPSLYALALSKEAWMADLGDDTRGLGH